MNNFIKKSAFAFLAFLLSFHLHAQNVAINSSGNIANSSAILDLSDASNQHLGFLMPNVSLNSTTDVSTISSPQNGLIAYNTNGAMTGGFGIGFYYWSGTSWNYMLNSGKNSSSYILNQATQQTGSNFYIQTATITEVGGVIEGLPGQTADILDIDNSSGTPQVYINSSYALNAILGLNAFGAAVNLNANSNFATNINSGTSTGGVSIGNNGTAANAVTILGGSTGGVNINTTGTGITTIGNAGTGSVTIGNSTGHTFLPEMATQYGILYSGSTGGQVAQSAALTNGQVLIGSTGVAPVAASISTTPNSGVSITSGAGSITIGTNGVLNDITTLTVTTQTIAVTGSYTVSAGTRAIQVELIGGGGGGATTSNANGAASAPSGGGGGAGGYVKFYLSPTAPGTVYSYTVGAGGAGAAVSGSGGSQGSSTVFIVGGTTYTAGGGFGGVKGTANIPGLGGAGGAASNGVINVSGCPGGNGTFGGTSGTVSGAGGSSILGGGGAPVASTSTAGTSVQGNAGAINSGGGGSGTATSGLGTTPTPAAGGNGAAGIIIITEYK